jgi:hypothetical protein
MMIGILVRRREQTENEVVQKTDTAARLAFADHMNRFVAGDRTPSSQNERKCWLARTRRLMAR